MLNNPFASTVSDLAVAGAPFVVIAGVGILLLSMLGRGGSPRATKAKPEDTTDRPIGGQKYVPLAVRREQAADQARASQQRPGAPTSGSSRGTASDDGDFSTSMAVGALTGSTILGYAAGGSLLGAVVGESLSESSRESDHGSDRNDDQTASCDNDWQSSDSGSDSCISDSGGGSDD